MPEIGEPIILKNHSFYERIEAIIRISEKYSLDLADKIKIDESDNGIISYTLEAENIQFKDLGPNTFRMELKELASIDTTSPNNTILDKYTFQGKHCNLQTKTWRSNAFIRFDFEPDTINYPTVHINAYPKKWGNHLSYPATTNLNLTKMSCPLAIEILRMYACNRDLFPADSANNQSYVEIFEEVDMYGNRTN